MSKPQLGCVAFKTISQDLLSNGCNKNEVATFSFSLHVLKGHFEAFIHRIFLKYHKTMSQSLKLKIDLGGKGVLCIKSSIDVLTCNQEMLTPITYCKHLHMRNISSSFCCLKMNVG